MSRHYGRTTLLHLYGGLFLLLALLALCTSGAEAAGTESEVDWDQFAVDVQTREYVPDYYFDTRVPAYDFSEAAAITSRALGVWNCPTHEATCEICGAAITVEGSGDDEYYDNMLVSPSYTTARTISFERSVTVCDKCYERYHDHIDRSLRTTWDIWLESTKADRAQDRFDAEMKRKQDKIKALEQEIKYLKKGE